MADTTEIWPGEYKPSLDDLLSDQQPVSPAFEVEIGDRLFVLAMRSISRAQIARLQLDARVYAREQVQRSGLPVEDLDSPYVADIVANELELRVLWASAVNPDSPGGRGPAFTIKKLRDTITPPQQELLNEKWYMWQTRSAPDNLDNEEIEFMIQAAKSKDFFFLLKFGTGKLCNCVRILAERLETCEQNKSSDGSSSNVPVDNTSEKTSLAPLLDLTPPPSSNSSPSPSVANRNPPDDGG